MPGLSILLDTPSLTLSFSRLPHIHPPSPPMHVLPSASSLASALRRRAPLQRIALRIRALVCPHSRFYVSACANLGACGRQCGVLTEGVRGPGQVQRGPPGPRSVYYPPTRICGCRLRVSATMRVCMRLHSFLCALLSGCEDARGSLLCVSALCLSWA
eukprot:583899-Rhodomonas_salina.4